MSSSDVYNSPSEPSAQHSFASTFDLDNPAKAASEYSRLMHAHTQRQYQVAAKSAERRGSGSSGSSAQSPVASLSTESSTGSSSSSASLM